LHAAVAGNSLGFDFIVQLSHSSWLEKKKKTLKKLNAYFLGKKKIQAF
jgi:hypothetical protein